MIVAFVSPCFDVRLFLLILGNQDTVYLLKKEGTRWNENRKKSRDRFLNKSRG